MLRQLKKKLPGAIAFLLIASATGSGSAIAQSADSTQEGIDDYRQMLSDGGNPGDLLVDTGKELWQEKKGPKNVSLQACDLGLGPGVVKGAYAQMPRFFKDADKVMDVETRILYCMETVQGINPKDITPTVFSKSGEISTDWEAIVAYVASESAGIAMAAPQNHEAEKAAYERGQKIFFHRSGPYDFSCATCHGAADKRIRLQNLPDLLNAKDAQQAYTTWPGYRVSQGVVRTMQWRLQDCFRQQRLPKLKFASQASIDLLTFLAVKAKEGKMAAPGIKR